MKTINTKRLLQRLKDLNERIARGELDNNTPGCPFCGSSRIMAEGTLARMSMVCQDCLARGPEVASSFGRVAALTAWNHRK
jgi:hypothetical protein